MDFEAYRMAAARVLAGAGQHLYEPLSSERMIFKYAPCWAILLAPLGWLPTHAGGVLWATLNVAAVAWTCALSARLCRLLSLRIPPYLTIIAIVILVRSVLSVFLLGQADALWALLVVASLYHEATKRRWLAALCLALAISLKLPALLFLLYLALKRRWELTCRVIAIGLALNLAAAWMLIPSQPLAVFLHWRHALTANAAAYAFDIGNQSLLALMGRLLRQDGYGLNLAVWPDPAVAAITALLQAILFGLVLWPASASSRAPAGVILDWALLTVYMVIFSPSCWVATYSALLFPMTIALGLIIAQAWPLRLLPLANAALIGLLAAMTSSKVWRSLGVRYFKGESYVFLVLMILPLLGLALAWTLWSQRAAFSRRYLQ